jgi:hypothetical protein
MQTTVDLVRVQTVRDRFPKEGLFAEKEWLVAPEPFFLDANVADHLERLGHWLSKFVRATNLLYRQSLRGILPRWVTQYCEAGKPADLIEVSRKNFQAIPRVIRPDIILTEEGWKISELDSVPGGIGLTAWLNQTYGQLGFDVVGGADGMIDAFNAIFPSGVIAISAEAQTYRPEMSWLVENLKRKYPNSFWQVVRAEDWDFRRPEAVYRFFELFDLPNLPSTGTLLAAARAGSLEITPPLKPFLEEKLSFALFWLRPLQEFWRRELSERHWLALRKLIPRTWVLDPTPIPHHGVIPGLEIQDWSELKRFSQKQREFVLKISGFSEKAWGSRGVFVGTDLSHQAWSDRIDEALHSFPKNPYILQRFHKGKLYEQRYLNPASGQIETMRGRVRLCPYYFVVSPHDIRLGGVLATIVPADKKIVHGMKDGVLVPAAISRGVR